MSHLHQFTESSPPYILGTWESVLLWADLLLKLLSEGADGQSAESKGDDINQPSQEILAQEQDDKIITQLQKVIIVHIR